MDGNEWTIGFLYAFETCFRKVVETEYLTPTSGIGIAFGREQIVNKLTKDKIIGYKVTIDGFRSFTDNGGEGAPLVTPMLRLSVARYAGLSQHELQLQSQLGLRVFGLFAVHYGYTVHLSGTAFEKMSKRSLSINAFIPVKVFAE